MSAQPWQAAPCSHRRSMLRPGRVLGADRIVGAERARVQRVREVVLEGGGPAGPGRRGCLRRRGFRCRAGCRSARRPVRAPRRSARGWSSPGSRSASRATGSAGGRGCGAARRVRPGRSVAPRGSPSRPDAPLARSSRRHPTCGRASHSSTASVRNSTNTPLAAVLHRRIPPGIEGELRPLHIGLVLAVDVRRHRFRSG